MLSELQIEERVKRVSEITMQYLEGAICASEMGAALVAVGCEIYDNTPHVNDV